MNPTLKLLFIANCLSVFSGTLVGPIYALFLERQYDIKQNIYLVGTAAFCSLFGSLFSSLLLRLKGEHQSHQRLLKIGFFSRGIIWALYPFAPSILVVFLLQFTYGFVDTFGLTGYDTLVAEHLDKNRHVRNFSDSRILLNFATIMAITVGTFVAHNFGFTPLFAFMSVVSFSSFLVVSRIK